MEEFAFMKIRDSESVGLVKMNFTTDVFWEMSLNFLERHILKELRNYKRKLFLCMPQK